MSILIKGMELPAECRECKMLTYYSTSGCSMCDITGNALARNFKPIPFDGRPDWCPLIEIHEPHGDLIDRNAFRADFSMGENCDKCGIELKRCEYDRIYTKMDFCGWLDDAPTVIEAEGSEDE